MHIIGLKRGNYQTGHSVLSFWCRSPLFLATFLTSAAVGRAGSSTLWGRICVVLLRSLLETAAPPAVIFFYKSVMAAKQVRDLYLSGPPYQIPTSSREG